MYQLYFLWVILVEEMLYGVFEKNFDTVFLLNINLIY